MLTMSHTKLMFSCRPSGLRGTMNWSPSRTPAWSMPLNERYSCGAFVIGKSNELAAAAAHAVAETPGNA